MDSSLCDLELRCIDPMTRRQLLDALRLRRDCLPPDLSERLDEQPDALLRLLLMAARLTYALRLLRGQYLAEHGGPRGAAVPLPEQFPPGHRGLTAGPYRGSNGPAPRAEP